MMRKNNRLVEDSFGGVATLNNHPEREEDSVAEWRLLKGDTG